VSDDPAGYVHNAPTYTPDGLRIIFTRCRPDPPGGCALYSMRTNGQDRHAVTAYVTDRADFFADVSPDGARVAFTRFGDRGIISQVWVSRIDGSHAHAVTTPVLEAFSPEWTKDGHHLLVSSNWSHVGENVYRIRDDGAQLTKLTNRKFPHNAEMAAPSPSGAKIVYADDQAYPGIIGADLFLMNPDGSGKHQVTSDGRLLDPDWGTAPLLKASEAKAPYAMAKSSASRQSMQLPGWVASRVGPATAGARHWSR
jgi:Tol biopolymer transport system component